MTPGELLWMEWGHARRIEREYELTAWLVHWLAMMNPYVRDKPTVDRIMGREKDQKLKTFDEVEAEREWLERNMSSNA